MLKSYKELSRWYRPLEPEPASPTGPHPAEATSAAPVEQDGPARYPNYIREEDPEAARARAEVPSDLPTRRAEFIGGWSDWVAGHAPGPEDEYAAPRPAGSPRFPWPDEDEFDDPPAQGATLRGPSRELREEARLRPGARRLRVLAVLVVACLLLGAAAVGVLYLLRSASNRVAGSPASMQFTAGSVHSSPVGQLPGSCPTERTDTVVRSAEAGGTDSGPNAILAFQHAYYVARSGEQARAVVAPDSPISSAAVIQQGINTVALGSTHCVRIQTLADNRYSVEITVYPPGGAPTTYNKQTVTTAVIDGRTLITGIAAG